MMLRYFSTFAPALVISLLAPSPLCLLARVNSLSKASHQGGARDKPVKWRSRARRSAFHSAATASPFRPVSNCAASVEPDMAVVEDFPPETAMATASK